MYNLIRITILVLLSLSLFSCPTHNYKKVEYPRITDVIKVYNGPIAKLFLTISNPFKFEVGAKVICEPDNVIKPTTTVKEIHLDPESDKVVSLVPDSGIGTVSCWVDF